MSFLTVSQESDFPIENLPYGIFRRKGTNSPPTVGVAIGEWILDLAVIAEANLFSGSLQNTKVFHKVRLS
jgi:fumarylacetoacetase